MNSRSQPQYKLYYFTVNLATVCTSVQIPLFVNDDTVIILWLRRFHRWGRNSVSFSIYLSCKNVNNVSSSRPSYPSNQMLPCSPKQRCFGIFASMISTCFSSFSPPPHKLPIWEINHGWQMTLSIGAFLFRGFRMVQQHLYILVVMYWCFHILEIIHAPLSLSAPARGWCRSNTVAGVV